MSEGVPANTHPPVDYAAIARERPRMTVISDGPLPRDDANLDNFDLPVKLAAMFDVLRHPRTQTPLAMAIYGDWGTGKTSAMRWLEAMLKDWNEHGEHKTNPDAGRRVRPVWFYPWKYHTRDDVWRGLVAEVILASVNVGQMTTARIMRAAKSFGTFLGRGFLHALSSVTLKAKLPSETAEVDVDLAALRDIHDEYRQAVHPERAFLNEFEASLQDWVTQTISRAGERMVIFIDDLDRCMPDVALEVLEALKLYLNIPDLVFVVGVDRDVINQLVRRHYETLGVDREKADQYLAKMFQVEVTMQPSDRQIERFLQAQLDVPAADQSDYWQTELSPEQRDVFGRVLLELARQNPREVKRLLGSMLVHGVGARHVPGASPQGTSRFAQGMQVFLVAKIVDETFKMRADLATQNATDFFRAWSDIVRTHPDAPRTLPGASEWAKRLRPSDEPSSMKDSRRPHEPDADLGAAPEPVELPSDYNPYRSLVGEGRFDRYLGFLANETLGELMRMSYPTDTAGLVDRPSDDLSTMLVREAVARKRNKPPEDLSPDDYREVTKLDLSDSAIADVTPLEKLVNLQTLDLTGTQVADVTPLEKLVNLQWLSLSGTQVADVTPLEKLVNLQRLYLDGTQVADVTPLEKLVNLQRLYLDGTHVADVTPLEKLVNLQWLYLNGTQVADVTPLEKLVNLQWLYLSGTQVADVTPLEKLVNLQWLSLSGTQVADVTPLEKLVNLQRLDLTGTHVADVTPLEKLVNLQWLYLNGTQVADVTPLEKLVNLQWLYLSGTQVADVTPLEKLVNLQWLYLNGTQVADVTPLEKLVNLQGLDLSDTQVADVKPLEKLVNLQGLDLSDTKVKDVTPLRGIKGLTIIGGP